MFFRFLNLRVVPKKSTPGKFAYIRHFQRIEINETKFEKMLIHFKSDVLTAICFHQMLPCTSFWYNKKIQKSYWTTVANTSPYASVHSSCTHLKTWKCQIFRGLPAPSLPPPPTASWGKPLTSTPSTSYPPLAFLSPISLIFSYHFFHLLKLCLDFLRTCFHIIRLLTRTFSLKRCGSKRSWT